MRDRKLREAIEKIEKVRGKPGVQPPAAKTEDQKAGEKKDDGKQPAAEEKQEEKKEETRPPAASQEKRLPVVRIDFDGIHERIRRVAISDASEERLFWSHDSKKLAFTAKINGQEGTYTISPPAELAPKLLSSKSGYDARWIARGNQILWRVDGVPRSLSADGKSAIFNFSAHQQVDRPARFQAAFELCWRTMRDFYYDGALNHRNWDEIRRKYTGAARRGRRRRGAWRSGQPDAGRTERITPWIPVQAAERRAPKTGWSEVTPHFGVRFAPDYQGPGLKVRDVIGGSPADQVKSRILAGEIVTAIDGRPIDPAIDRAEVANGRLDRDVRLTVRNAKGEDRQVTLRPITYGATRSLLYESWIKQNREAVAKASGGSLGYLHIRAMDMGSFYRFEHGLYDAGAGKDGLVIDVRENGGGSTTDHLLTALTQPVHAITVPRGGTPGYPQDRHVYATWSKPIVVLCNQNSFSNAEIFSHAIKTLGRGKLVGAPTAGAVVSTGAVPIMDLGMLEASLPRLVCAEDRRGHGTERRPPRRAVRLARPLRDAPGRRPPARQGRRHSPSGGQEVESAPAAEIEEGQRAARNLNQAWEFRPGLLQYRRLRRVSGEPDEGAPAGADPVHIVSDLGREGCAGCPII